jgi:spore maturation protein CgeB
MKPASAWKSDLEGLPANAEVQLVEGRGKEPTIRVGKVLLHSRYNPAQEAQRLLDSADLNPDRPVLVIGLGLGYHVHELRWRGFECAVAEPEPAVARLALDAGVCGTDFLLAVGPPDTLAGDDAFRGFAARLPQTLVHPATARIHPGYAEAVLAAASRAALGEQRLNIAVVGPLYGGSLPITKYLADAFRSLGHQTLLVDNSEAWSLYQAVTGSVQTRRASDQLGQMLSQVLAEWTYARVAEFDPEICVVMAQAPVGPQFPARLAQNGILSAFWYVENWRHLPYWRDIAPQYDFFFHIQPGEFERKLEEIGCLDHAFIQTGCDPAVHCPVTLSDEERREYECDLSFAGAGYYNRQQLFKGLTDYNFKIWGVDWPDRELARCLAGGERRFSTADFMRIVAGSKINLNLHSSASHDGVDPKSDAINPRVFEIAAAGGFQLCDPCIGLENHFDFESELPVYRSLPELRSRIDYYLAHPDARLEMAQRARARVLHEHTYEHRARQMLDLIIERHGARILRRGVRVQRTVGEMSERVEPGSALRPWLKTLPQDLLFVQEEINKHLRPARGDLAYPEQVFYYLKEVREFAESMLKDRR